MGDDLRCISRRAAVGRVGPDVERSWALPALGGIRNAAPVRRTLLCAAASAIAADLSAVAADLSAGAGGAARAAVVRVGLAPTAADEQRKQHAGERPASSKHEAIVREAA